jgi:peptidyl-prolyl cis-trans isomerase C
VREELIRRELLVQEAKKLGLDKKPDVAAQADLARQAIFIRAFVQDYRQEASDQRRAAQGRVRPDEDPDGQHRVQGAPHPGGKGRRCQAIIVNLKKGAKFDDLAKQSKDPGSRDKGGDLGWSSTAAYVKPFGDAVTSGQGQVHRNAGQDRFRLPRDPGRRQPSADAAPLRPDQAAIASAPAAGADSRNS